MRQIFLLELSAERVLNSYIQLLPTVTVKKVER